MKDKKANVQFTFDELMALRVVCIEFVKNDLQYGNDDSRFLLKLKDNDKRPLWDAYNKISEKLIKIRDETSVRKKFIDEEKRRKERFK